MKSVSGNQFPPPPPDKKDWPWVTLSQSTHLVMKDGQPWPKVSIVMPSYNQGEYIEESIRSVLLQNYPNIELIIIDGGSTDNTQNIINKYSPWISCWVSEPDNGQSHAINKGLARSTGTYFNWHNTDDVLFPGAIKTIVETFIKHPETSYIHGYRIETDAQLNITGEQFNPAFEKREGYLTNIRRTIKSLKTGVQPGSLMNRKLVQQLGGVDEVLHYAMDVDILIRLELKKPPYYIHTPTVYMRYHPASKSIDKKYRLISAPERLHIANKLFYTYKLPANFRKLKREAFSSAHYYAWRHYLKAEIYSLAAKHGIQAISSSPKTSIKLLKDALSLIKNKTKK